MAEAAAEAGFGSGGDQGVIEKAETKPKGKEEGRSFWPGNANGPHEEHHEKDGRPRDKHDAADGGEDGEAGAFGTQGHPDADGSEGVEIHKEQIGRASCRERV